MATAASFSSTEGGERSHDQQQPSQNDGDSEDDILMVCRCERPKILYDLLQSFSKHGSWSKSGTFGGKFTSGTQPEDGTLHKLHPMTVFCTKDGLTIHSQSSNKQSQASMDLPASLFEVYRLMEPSGDGGGDDDVSYDFTIHWQSFMQCLNLLMIGTGGDKVSGSHSAANFFRNHHNNANTNPYPPSALTLSYHTSTEVLRMQWEGSYSNNEGTIVATAAIPGLNPPPSDEAAELSAAFGQSPIAARWLCPQAGHELSDTKELDYLPGATTVRLRFFRASEGGSEEVTANASASGAKLRLSARGHSGRVSIEIPAPIEFLGAEHDGSSDRRADNKLAHSYSLAGWKRALQPLDMARETCLSVNTRGILAIQHQLVVDTAGGNSHRSRTKKRSSNGGNSQQQLPSESAFCDFLLLPLEVDEDRNDDSDEEDVDTRSVSEDYSDDDNDDDDRTLTPQKSTQRSLSQATRDGDINSDDSDDEAVVRLSTGRRKRRVRTILSATQDSVNFGGDDDSVHNDEGTNASLRQPIQGDIDDNNEESEKEATAQMKILFPTVTAGAGTDIGNRSNHHNRRRERERRKRQRRSSQSLQLEGKGTENVEEEQGDDESQAPSVNLLDDDDNDDDHNGNGRDGSQNDQNGYCSSPELVYGQQE